jgi:hypothetical protein
MHKRSLSRRQVRRPLGIVIALHNAPQKHVWRSKIVLLVSADGRQQRADALDWAVQDVSYAGGGHTFQTPEKWPVRSGFYLRRQCAFSSMSVPCRATTTGVEASARIAVDRAAAPSNPPYTALRTTAQRPCN